MHLLLLPSVVSHFKWPALPFSYPWSPWSIFTTYMEVQTLLKIMASSYRTKYSRISS
jgi:hypothetical protein